MVGVNLAFLVDFSNFRPSDIQLHREAVLSIALIFKKKLGVGHRGLLNSVSTLADRRNLLKTFQKCQIARGTDYRLKKVGFGVNPDSTRRRVISKRVLAFICLTNLPPLRSRFKFQVMIKFDRKSRGLKIEKT